MSVKLVFNIFGRKECASSWRNLFFILKLEVARDNYFNTNVGNALLSLDKGNNILIYLSKR